MIRSYLKQIEKEIGESEPERHNDKIQQIAAWIISENLAGRRPAVNFICTHNSRRSQFSQTWFAAVQSYFGLDIADSFSGGTEVTACNERTIAALERTGFNVSASNGDNPVYSLSGDLDGSEIRLWSKVYDDESNPSEKFAAVMTCDHADQNCPFIPGADVRIPLTYTDPKFADGTDEEASAYDNTCKMIAIDMMRVWKLVKQDLQKENY